MNSNVETGPCILGHPFCRRAWLVKNPTVDFCRECNAHLHQQCAKEHGSTEENDNDAQGFCCPDGHGCHSGKTAAATGGQGTPSSWASSAAQQVQDDSATPRRTQLLSSSDAQKMQAENLRTTPHRIQLLLAPELTAAEFAGIRKRVYDTAILGKGVHVRDDVDEADLPVVPTTVESTARLHNFEKFTKCGDCGNNEQAEFVLDPKEGYIICTQCGTVAIESNVHEGSQFRKFEGEADRKHHGDAANLLLSNNYNMGTSQSGVMSKFGPGLGGRGAQLTSNLGIVVRNAHAAIERTVETTDGRTRTVYKDHQKIDAFIKLKNVGDSLNLHEAVVQCAKEFFAAFRDDRESLQQYEGILAACLCEAFEQLQADHHELQHQSGIESNGDSTARVLPVQAARHRKMRRTTLTSNAGVVNTEHDNEATTEKPAGIVTDEQGHGKALATWDLEDCRSWLLEASHNIAQAWDTERHTNSGSTLAKKIPAVPLSDLEGHLVEHSFSLCEHLEAKLQSRGGNSRGRHAVATPHVADMSKLGINTRGGVGGLKRTDKSGSGRTAGQILLMMNAKMLGTLLQDSLAGEAFRRELDSVIGQKTGHQAE